MNIKKGIMGIYKITSPSGKIYIGSAFDIRVRCLRYLRYSCPSQTRLFNSLKKYGSENHIYEVIEECLQEDLFIRERHYQELYDCIGENGLNCVLVRTDVKPPIYTEEYRKKLSNNNKGRKMSEEFKINASLRMLGTRASEETKEKNRQVKTGKPLDKNGKEVRCISTGKVYPSVKALSDILGISYSVLYKKLSTKKKDFDYEFINPIPENTPKQKRGKKKVIHLESKMIFESINAAERYFNLPKRNLKHRLYNPTIETEFDYYNETEKEE